MNQNISSYVTSDRKGFKSGLLKIVKKAASLDAEFLKQRAVLGPRAPRSQENQLFGYYPKDEDFETDNDFDSLDGKKIVELIVVPGLGKLGDAHGDNYHVDNMLVKCRVIQESPQDQQSQMQSHVTSATSMLSRSPRPSFGASNRKPSDDQGKRPAKEERSRAGPSLFKRVGNVLVEGPKSGGTDRQAAPGSFSAI
jgi:hypothetical protein